MSHFFEELKSTSLRVALTIIITAILTMLGTIWISIKDPLEKIIFENVPKTLLFLLPRVIAD